MALGSIQPLTEMSIQVYFLGVKGGRCVRLTSLPPSCAIVMISGNLKFLEPSGPLQACKGTAVLLPLPLQPYMLCVLVHRVFPGFSVSYKLAPVSQF